MLFACSGITLPPGSSIQDLTRFVTSACLVREFNDKRNRNDDLRVGAADHYALHFDLFSRWACLQFRQFYGHVWVSVQ